MSFDFGSMVTDRTQADVIRGTAKGRLNASDVNRIAAACNAVSDMMQSYGYAVPERVRDDWATTDVPRAADMAELMAVVRQVCSLVVFMRDMPTLPENLHRLGFETANDIERCLAAMGDMAEKIPSTWVYCGTVNSGGIYS